MVQLMDSGKTILQVLAIALTKWLQYLKMAWLNRQPSKEHQSVLSITPYKQNILTAEGKSAGKLSMYNPRINGPALWQKELEQPAFSLDWAMKTDCLAMGTLDKILIFTLENDQMTILHQIPSSSPVTALKFSGENDMICVGTQDGDLSLFKLEGFQRLFSLKAHTGTVTAISFNQDSNQIASASLDTTCQIYTLSGTLVETLAFSEHEGTPDFPLMGVAFSHCGAILYTVASGDFSYVTQWDITRNFAPLTTHRIHSGPVSAFCMDASGFNIGVGTQDGWLKIISTRTMELEQDLQRYESRVNAVGFTADGRLLASSDDESRITILFSERSEGFFSKASKVWVASIFILYFYLSYFKYGN